MASAPHELAREATAAKARARSGEVSSSESKEQYEQWKLAAMEQLARHNAHVHCVSGE